MANYPSYPFLPGALQGTVQTWTSSSADLHQTASKVLQIRRGYRDNLGIISHISP